MGASVQLSLPPSTLFQFPPSSEPVTLPPPVPGSILAAPPFQIPDALYIDALDIKVPITIACVYAAIVISVNKYNKTAGNKAWGISKTKSFFWFVVAHNVFLAVYSAWTFVGMLRALTQTVQRFTGADGLASTVDSLCKVHGRHGLGNAVTYDPTVSQWVTGSPNVLLNSANSPDPSDLGRLWNEGLSFYGWFFYLSKFYEVLDTFIILAKGKRSSTLQTYHHAGAMLCMWAGIRYMSPPIWMFVFVNSFIHSLMVNTSLPDPFFSNKFLVHLLHSNGIRHTNSKQTQAIPHDSANYPIPCWFYICRPTQLCLLHHSRPSPNLLCD
jgi:hypothetical protein